MKLEKFQMLELDCILYMFIGTSKELKTIMTECVGESSLSDDDLSSYGLCSHKNGRVICSLLTDNCPKDKQQDVLTHEIIHGVHYLLDYIGHSMNYEHGAEMFAYYLSYYIKKGTEFLYTTQTRTGQTKKKLLKKTKQTVAL